MARPLSGSSLYLSEANSTGQILQKSSNPRFSERGLRVILERGNDFVDQSVGLGLLRGHEKIPVSIIFDLFDILARVFH